MEIITGDGIDVPNAVEEGVEKANTPFDVNDGSLAVSRSIKQAR